MLFFRLFLVSFIVSISIAQITILPARDTPPPDLSISNTTYSTPLNATNQSPDDDCAIVHSIQRTEDGLNYKILIDLNLNGRGCKKVIPWTVGPNENGMTVLGRDALTTCNTNSPYRSCRPVNSGPAGGLSLSFDPPIYSFPLTVPQNNPVVPFGYAGYYAYETESKGACANYGYTNLKTQIITTINGISHAGIAIAFPTQDQCDRLPTQDSFISSFSGKEAAERVFAFNAFMNPSNASFNLTGLFSMNQLPYGYVNVSHLLGIVDPFVCKANNTFHNVGNTKGNIHACPMTSSEWESVLPDVAIIGNTVDVSFGPNTTAYDQYLRDGQWIVPLVNTNTLPLNCFICSQMRDAKGSLTTSGGNYASGHMPMNLAFGPGCTALRAYQSHINAVVSVGGYVGISKDVDPFSGVWSISAGFPVRNMNQLGNTATDSEFNAQGSSTDSHMSARFTTTGGTNGGALNVDMDALRYVLCNGLQGAVMASGYNSTTGTFMGPLVSTLRTHNDNTPIWPNPFRWTSPLTGNSNCLGCTYPTIRSQKGWTIFDSKIWEASQGKECGKYQSDHSLWARILSMVNSVEADLTNVHFFSKWNDTSNRPDLYLSNALGLNLNVVSEFFPLLTNAFIPGIGAAAWSSLLGNLDKHACRPAPYPYFFDVNAGQQAIPLCTLLQRQLYYQTYALNETYRSTIGISTSTPDLNSASQTGIFNLLAPNIWFGVFHKSIFDGNSEWLMFMDDTFDRTGNSMFESDGIAQNVTGRIEMLIPTALVDIPYTKRANAIQNVVYYTQDSACLLFNQFNTPTLANYAYLSTKLFFGVPHGFVNYVVAVFTPVFSSQSTQTKFTYQTGSMVVAIKYPTGNLVNITNYIPIIEGNQLFVKLPYMTVSLVYEYHITVPILIGSITNNGMPIVDITSYFENTVSSSIIQNITLQNTNTLDSVGCDFNAISTPLPMRLYPYSCVLAGENPSIQTCYSTFSYIRSGSDSLSDRCSLSDACVDSDTFFIDSCGFALNSGQQSFKSSVHLGYDGSSLNYNLNGAVIRMNIVSEYNLDNCGIGSLFYPTTFGVQVCGRVSNAETAISQTIPCDGAYLPFEKLYSITNNTGVYQSRITWEGSYSTLITMSFLGPIVTFDIVQSEIWFVANDNSDICSLKGSNNVFCEYDPINTVFDLSFVVNLPFNCSEYDQNLFYNEDIQITSRTVSNLKLADDQSIMNYPITNYEPKTFICSNDDVSFDPTTATAITTTHTLSTAPSDQIDNTPFNFQQAYDDTIKGTKPICVMDFSNIVAPPGLLPINSFCFPLVNDQNDYGIFPNCTIIEDGVTVPVQKLKNTQIYRNVYGVYSNFSKLLIWQCQIMPSKANVSQLLNCTVNGDTGKRNGSGCFYYEDKLAWCQKCWNLSCGLNTFCQWSFLFLIIISLALLGFIGILIFVCVIKDKDNGKNAGTGDALMDWIASLEKLNYGIGE
jgi:hypothetical protein